VTVRLPAAPVPVEPPVAEQAAPAPTPY
jgi:hypothetical protein